MSDVDSTANCLPCGLHTFRRNTYFNGKLLTERDFADEQAYFVGKDRLHNSMLHGIGTVCGLELTSHPNEECRRQFLVLEPGMAIDCCGREIVVAERTVIDVTAEIEQAGIEFEDELEQDLFISICYAESGDEKVPVILPDCDCADGNSAFNRIGEGWDISVRVERAGALPAVRPPSEARLDWVQTLVLQGQAITAVTFDEETDQIYVAAEAEVEDGAQPGARVLVYDGQTHDLITAMETGRSVSDIAVSPRGDLIYVAGTGVEGANGVAIYREADIRSDNPTAPVIELDEALRLTVSDDGTLFVLLMDTGVIQAWQEAAVQDWLNAGAPGERPDNRRRFELGNTIGADAPARRGANAMRVSADGRLLFVLDPDAAVDNRQLRIIDVSRLFSGDPEGEASDEITVDVELNGEPVALAVSFDAEYVFVLGQDTGGTARLDRFAISQAGGIFSVVPEGRGGAWPGQALDLSLAPGEKWAYALEEDDEGRASVVSLLIDAIANIDSADPINPTGTREAIAGRGRFQRLAAGANRIYAASNDASENQPDRGLVAVIDVTEGDCGAIFESILGACPSCGDDDHCLTLAHLPSYSPGDSMQNPGEGGEDGVEIDNLTHRKLLPSASTIVEVVRCMLDQGATAGRPGPRGPAGLAGRDGADGQDGADGADGQDGADGLNDDLVHVSNLSWVHDEPSFSDDGEMELELERLGLVIAFDRGIRYASVRGNEELSQSGEVFKFFYRVRGLVAGGEIDVMPENLVLEPVVIDALDGDGRIIEVSPLPPDTEIIEAVRLLFPREVLNQMFEVEPLFFRVLLRADMIMDADGEFAVDGNHIFGAVPKRRSGNGVQGSSFDSWFGLSVSD